MNCNVTVYFEYMASQLQQCSFDSGQLNLPVGGNGISCLGRTVTSGSKELYALMLSSSNWHTSTCVRDRQISAVNLMLVTVFTAT